MKYNFLINPLNNKKISIFSKKGKQILKNYVINYKKGGSWTCNLCTIINDDMTLTKCPICNHQRGEPRGWELPPKIVKKQNEQEAPKLPKLPPKINFKQAYEAERRFLQKRGRIV